MHNDEDPNRRSHVAPPRRMPYSESGAWHFNEQLYGSVEAAIGRLSMEAKRRQPSII